MRYISIISYSGDPGEDLHGFFGRAATSVDGVIRALGDYGRADIISSVTAPARHGVRATHCADYTVLFEPANTSALQQAAGYLAASGFSAPEPYQPEPDSNPRIWK